MTNLVVLKGYKTKNFIYCNGCFGGKKKKKSCGDMLVVLAAGSWLQVLVTKWTTFNNNSWKYKIQREGQTDNGTDGCCVGLTDNVYCLKKNYVAYTYFCHIFC